MSKVKVSRSSNDKFVGLKTYASGKNLIIPQMDSRSNRVYYKAHYSHWAGNIDRSEVLYIPDGFKWKYSTNLKSYYTEDEAGEGKYTFTDIASICNDDEQLARMLLRELTGEHPVVLAHTFVKLRLFVPSDKSTFDKCILDETGVHMDFPDKCWQHKMYPNVLSAHLFKNMVHSFYADYRPYLGCFPLTMLFVEGDKND